MHFHTEGTSPQDGFNFYRLSDEGSAGFFFAKGGKRLFVCRYSKVVNRLYFGFR